MTSSITSTIGYNLFRPLLLNFVRDQWTPKENIYDKKVKLNHLKLVEDNVVSRLKYRNRILTAIFILVALKTLLNLLAALNQCHFVPPALPTGFNQRHIC